MAKPVAVTDTEFEQKVLQADVPVAVDFWAPWCAPCRVVGPILDKLAGEYDGRMVIAKVNTDEEGKWAGKFGIQGIPTIILFKDGKEVDRMVGSRPESAYRTAFDKLLSA
jgi:thioredoxin 1